MRVFQNAGLYPAYLTRLNSLREADWGFARQLRTFLVDGFGAAHILLPVIEGDEGAFFTNSDDEILQRRWALEHGLRGDVSLDNILLAQLEEHRTEVWYNLDPMRYQGAFVRRLPGCVRKSLAWRAAPSPGADLSAYDTVVCNFPAILQRYRALGWRAAYFSPAHHPLMDAYAANTERPYDVIFVGGYSRHHRRRGELLQAVARLQDRRRIVFHLDRSRMTRLAESGIGRLLPLARHRRPDEICRITRPALFGAELYHGLSQAKIVLNGAIDMAGIDRGNLRCFEAMGCRSLMISDIGQYPNGMLNDVTMLTYGSVQDALAVIERALDAPERALELAAKGLELMRTQYSKENQWQRFRQLVEDL